MSSAHTPTPGSRCARGRERSPRARSLHPLSSVLGRARCPLCVPACSRIASRCWLRPEAESFPASAPPLPVTGRRQSASASVRTATADMPYDRPPACQGLQPLQSTRFNVATLDVRFLFPSFSHLLPVALLPLASGPSERVCTITCFVDGQPLFRISGVRPSTSEPATCVVATQYALRMFGTHRTRMTRTNSCLPVLCV